LFTIYFIFAFFAYCVFSIFYILQFYGFIKVSFLSYNAVPLSTISEIIFLFLAVLERFHYIEKTQRETDKMFLEASQKNKEILLQQNELLEKHVTERTFEIQILNQELSATNEILLQRNDELSKTNECLEIQKQTLEQTLNELKQTQERLIQSEKMASLGTLIAGIAHEINNPLNFIDGGLNLLQGIKPDNELSKDKMQLSLQMIKEGVTRSSNIVKALNTYSYKGNARLQNYDIQKIIDNSLLFLKSKYIEKISIIKNYQIDKEILVYPEKLHQVFLNLLNNAIFAIGTDPIIENPVIEISTNIVEEKLKQFAYISIFNNGPLIPEDDIGKIFDPFFTTKEPGEGTGLGLSITYKIIEEHFGSIIAENTSNGVIFIIKIPIITA
jgi:C4-dicarboxylate-specific signal transduction histidine kinase